MKTSRTTRPDPPPNPVLLELTRSTGYAAPLSYYVITTMANVRAVLIVDDDATLRSALESSLEAVGYRVLSTGDPDTAYRLLTGEPVTAVLLDVRLPTMSGLALSLAISRRWPYLEGRIALMTGDADAPDVRAWARRNPCTLLRKPFTLRQVATWLHGVARAADPAASAG